MAAARLSDSQKQELVRRFRQGESTQVLADQFGCSATTVTRMVRAEVGTEEYASLRDQRQRRAGRDRQISLAIDSQTALEDVESHGASPAGAVALPAPEQEEQTQARRQAAPEVPDPSPLEPSHQAVLLAEGAADGGAEAPTVAFGQEEEEALASESDGVTVLAIDDADDFADDMDSEDDLLLNTDEDEETETADSQHFHPVAILPIAVEDQREILPTPWSPEVLPSCAYLLVDKTVELQARPLAEIPELGRLPSEEQERQALVLFTNPRQAKRHCGRTQRVIKLPDPALLGRTAPYLRAQGISRVVIEGALYALPEDQ